ncbi:hypothetical protein BpHYR1_035628 [Brachionus plicatilis]|uniref:Uncharacterized protein n=1 Tax=Brachionus plicatilis TaxID=10195 RepID=A0A3M7RPV2_BRAPC|nr:hypothetical protein BpHYR1_035628 [Brachionus plicatilis]
MLKKSNTKAQTYFNQYQCQSNYAANENDQDVLFKKSNSKAQTYFNQYQCHVEHHFDGVHSGLCILILPIQSKYFDSIILSIKKLTITFNLPKFDLIQQIPIFI